MHALWDRLLAGFLTPDTWPSSDALPRPGSTPRRRSHAWNRARPSDVRVGVEGAVRQQGKDLAWRCGVIRPEAPRAGITAGLHGLRRCGTREQVPRLPAQLPDTGQDQRVWTVQGCWGQRVLLPGGHRRT